MPENKNQLTKLNTKGDPGGKILILNYVSVILNGQIIYTMISKNKGHIISWL